MKKVTCQKCGHEWQPRIPKPVMCPRCKTYKWNVKTKADAKKLAWRELGKAEARA